jgi:AraC-like DNA-binding protein/tetratricopeptide (TPR) repeat protein
MTREVLDRAFRLAVKETGERIRQDWRDLPQYFAPLAPVIAEHFFEAGFTVEKARIMSGVDEGNPPLDSTCLGGSGRPDEEPPGLAAYITACRVYTALRILELTGGRIPTGRVAAAVGLRTHPTWCGAVRRVTGKKPPPLVRLEAQLEPRFDQLTLHLAYRRQLSPEAAAMLLERLWRRDPGALAGPPPAARDLPFVPPNAPAPRGGGISEAAAARARERAAEAPRERLRKDSANLPDCADDCGEVLLYVAEHLFDEDLKGTTIRERLDISDHGITSQVLFYLGHSLAHTTERLRVEAALSMVADCRFILGRIGEELGMSPDRATKAFKRRTGVEPKAVRATAAATAGHESRRLWLAVESGQLDRAQLRWVAGYLRGLQPKVFAGFVAQPLAVRRDVDAQRVQSVVMVQGALEPDSEERKQQDKMVTTHQDYSVDHWYVHWVRDRLGGTDLRAAWAEWQVANRRLGKLLELSPAERLEEVRRDPECQSDAFLWLLVDCVAVRLFHDAAESEHFADLAVAAAWAREKGTDVAGMRALTAALKANALRRRNELEAAAGKFQVVFGILAESEVDPWIEGRVHSLYASLLYREGEEQRALGSLAIAAGHFKKAGDRLERVRCAVERSSAWVAKGVDPSTLLTPCIAILERYPFATDVRNTAHINRILSSIYVADQLTGAHLANLKDLRAAMPPASSAFAAAQYQQIDGLIAALDGQPEIAVATLEKAAVWFEEHNLFADAAATWLLYSWAVLVVDSSAAAVAARTAYTYMVRTGFRSQGLQRVALRIYQDARRGDLRRAVLRRGILQMVCPRMEVRLASEAEPLGSVAAS